MLNENCALMHLVLITILCGEGNGNPLQHSCLENPMDGGTCQATDHGVTNNQTQLSDFISTSTILRGIYYYPHFTAEETEAWVH